jgi:hypothetical protein
LLRRTTDPGRGPPGSGPAAPRAAAFADAPWPLGPTLALFSLAWLALSWPWLSGRVVIPWDAKAHFYPQLQFLAQSLHRGESPFWAPFVFSGHPQVADPQSLIFSPPFLLLAAIDPDPSFRAADAVVLAMLGLGGTAIILFFRERGWEPLGAVVAALAFAFGASAAWRIQHIEQVMSLSYWPIALWLLTLALDRGSLVAGLCAGVAAGSMALGRDQVAYLGLWLLLAYVIWSWLDAPLRSVALRRSLAPLALGATAAAVVVAVPITLTVLLSESSNRAEIDVAGAGQGSLHPALLLTAFVPNLFGADGPFLDYWGPPSPRWGQVDLFFARNMGVLYIGALPVVALVAGVVRGVLWAREIRFFTLTLAAMLLYALGRYTPFFPVLFKLLPGVDLFRRPGDATFLVGALGALVGGYPIQRWWSGDWPTPTPRQRAIEIGILALVFAVALALAAAKGTLALSATALASAALWIAAAYLLLAFDPARLARATTLASAVVLGFLALDLARNNGPNESTALPPAQFDVLQPDSRSPLIAALKEHLRAHALGRVELTGLGFDWPNASLVHRLHNVLGYNPVRLGLYSAATGAEDHVALPEQRKFSPLFPSYRSTLADLLGLRFIATGMPVERIDPKLRPGDLNLVGQYADGFLYENPRALPRAGFALRAQPADFAATLRTGEWPDVDLRTAVLLDRHAGSWAGHPRLPPAAPTEGMDARADPRVKPEDGHDGAGGTARIISYGNTVVEIEAESPAGGHVVLNDPWHPWWFATVDGREAPILRANALFRAVAVPPGRHTVRFTFHPLGGAWRELAARLGMRLG